MPRDAPRLSFAQFQATRIRCEDLGTALSDATLVSTQATGFLYLSQPPNEQGYTGGLFIEEDGPQAWRLVLADDEEVTTDLEALERRLYLFAVGNGYIEADRFSEAVEKLASAAVDALAAWDDARVPPGSYPAYLPSFDEFVSDLIAFRDEVCAVNCRAATRCS